LGGDGAAARPPRLITDEPAFAVRLRNKPGALARAVADRVYSLQRDQSGLVMCRPLEATPSYAEFVGEMSFGGPRPERPGFVQQLTERIPFYGQRHVVKPTSVIDWSTSVVGATA